VIANLPVSLEIDGHVAGTANVTLQPHAAGSVVFPSVVLTAANTRATVRIPDDALDVDNAFHFVLSPPRAVPLAIVNGGGRNAREAALYLGRALGIGDTPRFDVTMRSADELSNEVLSRTRVVIFNDASASEAVVARLTSYVEAGGGLL